MVGGHEMKTELRIEGRLKTYTYDLPDCPLVPEGQLIYTPKVASSRVVVAVLVIDKNDNVTQRLVAT